MPRAARTRRRYLMAFMTSAERKRPPRFPAAARSAKTSVERSAEAFALRRLTELQVQPARARPDLFDLGAGDVRHGEEQVRRRLLVLGDDVAVALQAPVGAADDDGGRVGAIVLVAVAHPAAPVEHRVIEEAPVAVLGRLQLLEELGELDDLIRADLRVLRQLLRVVAVVRDAVVRLGDADVMVA